MVDLTGFEPATSSGEGMYFRRHSQPFPFQFADGEKTVDDNFSKNGGDKGRENCPDALPA
jgi:hypothetical protein